MAAPAQPPGFGPPALPPGLSSPPPSTPQALPVAPAPSNSPSTAAAPATAFAGSPSGGGGNQANSPTLIMGSTGSGKTSLIATLVRHVAKHYNKVTLIASCDGGGVPMEIQKLIATGQARYWKMYSRDPGNRLNLAWDTMLKGAAGWWPMSINPITGECPIGVPLMPPLMTLFTIQCPNGHVVKQTTKAQDTSVAVVCPSCHTLVNDVTMKVRTETRRPAFFDDVGGFACEGLTSMCAWGEEDLGNRAARGDLEGMKAAIGGAVVSGDFTLGQVTMSHVGFIQQQARTLLLNAQGIPGLVVPPVFTSLTLDATSEGIRICGPLLSGKAKTNVVPSWVGNCLEAEKRDAGAGRYQFRLWLNQWKDSEGVVHLCKNRASPGVLPDYLEDPPLTNSQADKATAFTGFSLGKFFEMLDQALTEGVDAEIAASGRARVENKLVTYEDPFASLGNVAPAVAPVSAIQGPPGAAAPPTSMPQAPAMPPAMPPTTTIIAATAPMLVTLPLAPTMSLAPPPTIAPPPGRRMAPPAAAPIKIDPKDIPY